MAKEKETLCREKKLKKGILEMNNHIFTIGDIEDLVKPIAEKYKVKEIYLFGSYARGEADESSDLDFLVFGGGNFKLTMIFSLAEDLRKVLKKMLMCLKLMKLTKTVIFIM